MTDKVTPMYLKKYFTPWFISCGSLFGIMLLTDHYSGSVKNDDVYIATPIITLVLTLFCSSLNYFNDTKWAPREMQSHMKKSPFIEFYELGFKREENYLIGKINEYQVMIFYNLRGSKNRPSVSCKILFNPKKNFRFMDSIEIKALSKKYKRSKLNWHRNFLEKEWNFNFTPPQHTIVFQTILNATEVLLSENIQPISIAENEQLEEELLRYLEKESERKV